jgi:pyruvate dehydrogenase E1 component alpha subunit
MPRKIVYHADIEYLQILDENGKLDEELAKDTLSDVEVKALYEHMVICRDFDEGALKLQRSGRMGTFPQNKGQEAASVGAVKALRKGYDYIVPSYRENAGLFLHGLPMHLVYLFWMGDERGNQLSQQLQISPLNIAIGTQPLHAVGISWAHKLRHEDRVTMTFFSEGATSTGDFHEAMNFASVFKPSLVFSCLNNGWAISMPCCNQTGSQTFAQKALAYGMPTIQVDGNDIFAVYKAHKDAVDRARAGGGPSFIESLTYRLGDHTTADDARRYRTQEELQQQAGIEPLVRTRKYLESKGLWDDEQQKKLDQRAKIITQEVTQVALTMSKPSPDDIFDFVYGDLPEELAKQKQTMRTESIGQDPEQIGLKMTPQEHHV